jgi:quercetin dioxygenase-like cupin family protein
MATLEVKRFDSPENTRPFQGHGQLEMVTLNGHQVGRAVFEPGWRWSENVKPIAQTESCQVDHLSYVVSGKMRVRMDDGTEGEIGPGDVVSIPSGHDAEVVGDEPCVMVDLAEDEGYAEPG